MEIEGEKLELFGKILKVCFFALIFSAIALFLISIFFNAFPKEMPDVERWFFPKVTKGKELIIKNGDIAFYNTAGAALIKDYVIAVAAIGLSTRLYLESKLKLRFNATTFLIIALAALYFLVNYVGGTPSPHGKYNSLYRAGFFGTLIIPVFGIPFINMIIFIFLISKCSDVRGTKNE